MSCRQCSCYHSSPTEQGLLQTPEATAISPPHFGKRKASADVAGCTRSTQKQQQVCTWLSPAEHPGYATNPATSFRKWSCNQRCADYTTEFQAALPEEAGAKLPAGSPGSPGCLEGPLLLSQLGSHLPAQAAPVGSPLGPWLEAVEEMSRSTAAGTPSKPAQSQNREIAWWLQASKTLTPRVLVIN